jgi:hypothetical protein
MKDIATIIYNSFSIFSVQYPYNLMNINISDTNSKMLIVSKEDVPKNFITEIENKDLGNEPYTEQYILYQDHILGYYDYNPWKHNTPKLSGSITKNRINIDKFLYNYNNNILEKDKLIVPFIWNIIGENDKPVYKSKIYMYGDTLKKNVGVSEKHNTANNIFYILNKINLENIIQKFEYYFNLHSKSFIVMINIIFCFYYIFNFLNQLDILYRELSKHNYKHFWEEIDNFRSFSVSKHKYTQPYTYNVLYLIIMKKSHSFNILRTTIFLL